MAAIHAVRTDHRSERPRNTLKDDGLPALSKSPVMKKIRRLLGRRECDPFEDMGRRRTLNIVGANTRRTKIVSLYGRLFSHAETGHRSENEKIREAVGEVPEGVRKRAGSGWCGWPAGCARCACPVDGKS